jgi:hypothetical protein
MHGPQLTNGVISQRFEEHEIISQSFIPLRKGEGVKYPPRLLSRRQVYALHDSAP